MGRPKFLFPRSSPRVRYPAVVVLCATSFFSVGPGAARDRRVGGYAAVDAAVDARSSPVGAARDRMLEHLERGSQVLALAHAIEQPAVYFEGDRIRRALRRGPHRFGRHRRRSHRFRICHDSFVLYSSSRAQRAAPFGRDLVRRVRDAPPQRLHTRRPNQAQ